MAGILQESCAVTLHFNCLLTGLNCACLRRFIVDFIFAVCFKYSPCLNKIWYLCVNGPNMNILLSDYSSVPF